MTMTEFLEHSQDPSRYLYYFGPIELWNSELKGDLYPIAPLELPAPSSSHSYPSATSIWMGNAKVTAQLHYDRSHNFFVQVYGTKRWLIFPPSQWEEMYLYPILHPHYHQSQVDFDAPNLEAFPEFENAEAIEAIVKPGDMMYIPPINRSAYWFHRVEALDFCISVSTVSPSEEETIFGKAYWEALPLKSNWDIKKKILVIRFYIRSVMANLEGEKGANEVIHKMLLKNRYRNFVKGLTPLSDMENDLKRRNCYVDEPLPRGMESTIEKLEPIIVDQCNSFRSLPKDIRNINLANYFEELISWAAGSQNVVAFLSRCF